LEGKVDDKDVIAALTALGDTWPTQSRPNVAPGNNPQVSGMCLGLVPTRQIGVVVGWVSRLCPSLTKLIFKWANSTLPGPPSVTAGLGLRPRQPRPSQPAMTGRTAGAEAAGGGDWIGQGRTRDCRCALASCISANRRFRLQVCVDSSEFQLCCSKACRQGAFPHTDPSRSKLSAWFACLAWPFQPTALGAAGRLLHRVV
jgi:hypothetical protein